MAVFFWGGEGKDSEDKIFRPVKMLIFALIIVFLTFLGLRVKFSRWDKNSLGGQKIHQVDTSETIKCVKSSFDIYNSLLCIIKHETLLDVTLKGRGEISALIFPCLLRFSTCLARI